MWDAALILKVQAGLFLSHVEEIQLYECTCISVIMYQEHVHVHIHFDLAIIPCYCSILRRVDWGTGRWSDLPSGQPASRLQNQDSKRGSLAPSCALNPHVILPPGLVWETRLLLSSLPSSSSLHAAGWEKMDTPFSLWNFPRKHTS